MTRLDHVDRARRFRADLVAGRTMLGGQIALTDPAVVEILGRAGYDWLLLDTEHAPSHDLSLRAMLHAAVASNVLLLVRPIRLHADWIMHALDLGAPGVFCPFISTPEDAHQLVAACRYPPDGFRSWGPRRATNYGFDSDDYYLLANEAVILIGNIETEEAIDNIDAIVDIEGLDGLMIGPLDLSLRLGVFQQFEHPRYLAAVSRVRESCRRARVAFGTGCYSVDHARQCAAAGDQLLLIGGDDGLLAGAAQERLDTVRTAATGVAPNDDGAETHDD
jgi:4-hydroxy-2-oxoheptanedioate aldolase